MLSGHWSASAAGRACLGRALQPLPFWGAEPSALGLGFVAKQPALSSGQKAKGNRPALLKIVQFAVSDDD
jgi:hypothetical protein